MLLGFQELLLFRARHLEQLWLAFRLGKFFHDRIDVGSDPVRGDQAVVSGVAVNLQDAAKTLQYTFGMLSAAAGGIGEGHARW